MDDGVERGPFLEENVDELVGHEARSGLDGLVNTRMRNRARTCYQSLRR